MCLEADFASVWRWIGRLPAGWSPNSWADQLYLPLSEATKVETKPVQVVAIPYFAWGNRGLESMRVWIPTAK